MRRERAPNRLGAGIKRSAPGTFLTIQKRPTSPLSAFSLTAALPMVTLRASEAISTRLEATGSVGV